MREGILGGASPSQMDGGVSAFSSLLDPHRRILWISPGGITFTGPITSAIELVLAKVRRLFERGTCPIGDY